VTPAPRRDDEEGEMRKLIVSEFLSIDGVMEDPGGAESYDRGGWAFKFDRGPEGDKFKLDEVMEAGAMLLGRTTYEGFAEAWPGRTDEAGFADKMNGMPKYVVSRTLEKADWNNTTVLRGDLATEVSALKAEDGPDILVAGSGELVRGLQKHNLVDEYRLMVFPVLLGRGKRLFGDELDVASFRLAESKAVGAGVLILIYHPA
jgi:dihydrofolate reductase